MTSVLAQDRGAVSTFLAVIALALLMAAGLAIDGGRKVNALREASHVADNAARAGAQAVDLDTLRTTGDLQLFPSEVADRVEGYLTTLGYAATNVTVDGCRWSRYSPSSRSVVTVTSASPTLKFTEPNSGCTPGCNSAS